MVCTKNDQYMISDMMNYQINKDRTDKNTELKKIFKKLELPPTEGGAMSINNNTVRKKPTISGNKNTKKNKR